MVSIHGGCGETEASVSESWTGETVWNPRRATLIKNPLWHRGGLGLVPEGPWARGCVCSLEWRGRSLEALTVLWKHTRPGGRLGPFRRALTLVSHLHLTSDLANSRKPWSHLQVHPPIGYLGVFCFVLFFFPPFLPSFGLIE